MRVSILFAFASYSSLLFGASLSAPAPEDSVYIYALFRSAPDTPSCAELISRLKSVGSHKTAIVSIEPDSGFLLDAPSGEAQLVCVLSYLQKTSRTAKALFLQDSVFLERSVESARRAKLLGDFAARYPGLLQGVQIDVEPYSSDRWCCSIETKRGLIRELHQLLATIREQLGGVPLGVNVPWWYPVVADEMPEASPQSLFQVVDEIYIMVYGDRNGPLVGGTAESVLSRIDDPLVFSGKGKVYVTLATYEFQSPGQLKRESEKLRRRLVQRPTFSGVAVFHADSPFHVPLLRLVSGIVTDRAGSGLPGVEVTGDGIHAISDECGKFSLRGLPAPRVSLLIQMEGYQARTIPVELRKPGRQLQLRTIVLERDPQSSIRNSPPPTPSRSCGVAPLEGPNIPSDL